MKNDKIQITTNKKKKKNIHRYSITQIRTHAKLHIVFIHFLYQIT